MVKLTPYPEEGELVICTVRDVKGFGAFVLLTEYNNREGFIHVAEVATGWVKYIRDHVREGQKIVCKVLRVDPVKEHIDLSLKQVNEHAKKDKIQEVLKDHPILPGDTLVGKANRIYEVVGTGYGRGGLQVELRRKDDPSQKAHIGLEGYLMTKGLLTTQDLSSFVTGYAAKDHEENFAEMIAYWCQDKLPEDQVEMLKTVL